MTIISSELVEKEMPTSAICIIGSGAAGLTLACELDNSIFSVLLLEAGGFQNDPAPPEDYTGTATLPHSEPSQFRRFAFGGTTSIWGGRCVPFDPIDFERRTYVSNSGWPISYEDVARYYPKALEYCDAGSFDFSVKGSLDDASPIIPGFDNDKIILADRIERYSLPTDFGKSFRQRMERSKNVTVLLHARCVNLKKRPGEDGIEAIEIVDRHGRRRQLRAQIFVLAVGGIETPRLLFASDPDGSGLGNHTDRLGRFYACHFENICARVIPHGTKLKFDFEKTKDGVYCRRKLQFSSAGQRQHGLLNSAFRLHFPDYSDASHGSSIMSAIYLAKAALVPEYRNILQKDTQLASGSPASNHLRNVIHGLPRLMGFAFEWLFLRQLAHRKLPYTLVPNADGSYPLEFNSEQTPIESSRILPTMDRDRFGLRRVNVDWRISSDDVEAACRAFCLLRDAFGRTRACRLEFDEEKLGARLARSVPIGGHHLGTARMAAAPSEGVVNHDCAVFGFPNLYIASSAVFPTISHANPTLTVVAMAIRLAQHLKASLGGGIVHLESQVHRHAPQSEPLGNNIAISLHQSGASS